MAAGKRFTVEQMVARLALDISMLKDLNRETGEPGSAPGGGEVPASRQPLR